MFMLYHMQIITTHVFSTTHTKHAPCSFFSTNHEISTLHMAQQHTMIHVSISIHN